MSTVSNIRCDFCGSPEYDVVYAPIGSKRESLVCICKQCDLVFSTHSDIPYSREPNISGDADWGNVRFCKGQRFDAIQDLLPINAIYVLDVGSSRGHFARWYQSQNPDARITAIEPDTRVNDLPDTIDFYEGKLEDSFVSRVKDYFDLIYCCQTLEHVNSASQILKIMYDILRPGGKLFLEVPNIEVCNYPLNVEEFFIDKHNFHFSRKTLCNYMEKMGFELEQVNGDNQNVRILAVKALPTNDAFALFPRVDVKALLKDYEKNIKENRGKLPALVRKVNRIMEGQSVAFWGANTLLDLMVKYGEFDPTKRGFRLVDSYIQGGMEVHGVPIQDPIILRVFQPDVCIVLARFSADEIVAQARKFGIRNVIKFMDLL